MTLQVNQFQLKIIWSFFNMKDERATQQLNFIFYFLEIFTSPKELHFPQNVLRRKKVLFWKPVPLLYNLCTRWPFPWSITFELFWRFNMSTRNTGPVFHSPSVKYMEIKSVSFISKKFVLPLVSSTLSWRIYLRSAIEYWSGMVHQNA